MSLNEFHIVKVQYLRQTGQGNRFTVINNTHEVFRQSNGPAIWGGCVTRRSTGQSPGTLATKLSRCKEGMARVFAVMVQILLSAGAIAVQV